MEEASTWQFRYRGRQELCNMALLTAYNELNSELEHEGLLGT